MKIQAKPTDICIIQVYAPNENEDNTEKDLFYEELNTIIKDHKKSRDQLVIMGDFNAKVGDKREQKIIGNFGLGDKSDNGERLVEFCQRQNLMISNTWFEKRENSRHTWTSPDGKNKNQIDFILVSQRYRKQRQELQSKS